MKKCLANITKQRIDEIYGVLKSSDRTFSPSDDNNKSVRSEKLEVSKENQVLYFIRDYLGNIKSIFDENGEILYYRLYDEFGGESEGQGDNNFTVFKFSIRI